MSSLDSENLIISRFQSVECSSVYFPIESEDAIKVFEMIHDPDKWLSWKYSAGKADPPPDFYSDDYACMMEVMRVDDHSYKNKKGKIVNPTNMHIREVEKEIEQSGIMKMFPNANLWINASTNLPTNEDHNYSFYYKNFARIVKHHIDRIELYKTNHPDYKIIFFIMDESSGYFKVGRLQDIKENRKVGDMVCGQLHFHFRDKNFLSVFSHSEIDYLIWYTPFKLVNSSIGILDIPRVCVFDIKKMSEQYITYDSKYMLSVEL